MKRIVQIIFWMFVVFGSSNLFGSDRIPQRVELIMDTNSQLPVVFTIYEAVLAMATNLNELVLVSSDSNEQVQINIKNIHGRVLLSFTQTDGVGKLELSSIKNDQTNVFDSVLIPNLSNWVGNVDGLAANVLDKIKKHFPPRKKKVLEKLEIHKRKVSAFEPIKPKIKVHVLPINALFRLNEEAFVLNTQDSSEDNRRVEAQTGGFGVAAGVEWHYLNWLLAGEFTYLPHGSVMSFYGMTGLFNSLILFGLGVNRIEGGFNITEQWKFNQVVTNITAPSFQGSRWVLSTALQVNMRPGYFFRFCTGVLDFGQNYQFTYPAGFGVTESMNVHSNPPFMDILLNMEVYPGWNLLFRYVFSNVKIYTDINNLPNVPTPYYMGDIGSNYKLYFSDMRFDMIHYGVGVEHVF